MNNDSGVKDITGSNLYSIKDKLTMLDEKITVHNQEMAQQLVSTQDFLNELVEINKRATNTPQTIHKEVISECNEKEDQINKHISHQKAENLRINTELSDLKTSHSEFQIALQVCQRKLAELQTRIGVDLQVKG
jgi:hypothetical protein